MIKVERLERFFSLQLVGFGELSDQKVSWPILPPAHKTHRHSTPHGFAEPIVWITFSMG